MECNFFYWTIYHINELNYFGICLCSGVQMVNVLINQYLILLMDGRVLGLRHCLPVLRHVVWVSNMEHGTVITLRKSRHKTVLVKLADIAGCVDFYVVSSPTCLGLCLFFSSFKSFFNSRSLAMPLNKRYKLTQILCPLSMIV